MNSILMKPASQLLLKAYHETMQAAAHGRTSRGVTDGFPLLAGRQLAAEAGMRQADGQEQAHHARHTG